MFSIKHFRQNFVYFTLIFGSFFLLVPVCNVLDSPFLKANGGSLGIPSSPSIAATLNVTSYVVNYTKTWQKIFDGTAKSMDYCMGVALDDENNVYAVGTLMQLTTNNDIFVAKYTKDGILLWNRTYSSEGSNSDGGQGIAIDADGNIYVAGSLYDAAHTSGDALL